MGTPFLGWFMGLLVAGGILEIERGNWAWLNLHTIAGWILVVLSLFATKYLHDKHEEQINEAYNRGCRYGSGQE